MGYLNAALPIFIFIGIRAVIQYLNLPVEIPQYDNNQYWGPGSSPEKWDTSINEFKIDVSQEVLKDLKWRLNNVRSFTPPLEGIQHQYGLNTKLLQTILEYWRTQYNWTERQEYLNQFPQFTTNIQGLDIHYLHVKPKNAGNKLVLPLIILHGWPGSVREFYDFIPLLTTPSPDRDFVFEVVAPHIPGFGFSQAASKPGLGPVEIGIVMKNLMHRLGFDQFYCQGGDFGSIILQALSAIYPEVILGFHTNMPFVMTRKSQIKIVLGKLYPNWIVKPEHYTKVYPLGDFVKYKFRETGYLHLQATKPDTLGVALNESPIGMAAYYLEKFITGMNVNYQKLEDGGLLNHFTYTALLDNVMLYWITNSATTSFRLYSETFNGKLFDSSEFHPLKLPVKAPTAISRFYNDIYTPDGVLSEIFPHVVHLMDYDGGHFAAFDDATVLANDLFNATGKFFTYNQQHKRYKSEK